MNLTIPGSPPLSLTCLIVDVNGTLTDRGRLIDGVAERIARVRESLEVHLLSADTFGTLDAIADRLGVRAERVETGADKAAIAHRLDAGSCVAIGNGNNDVQVLEAVALGIAVIGLEGAAGRAVAAADVVCASITEALDLVLDPRSLVATLRP